MSTHREKIQETLIESAIDLISEYGIPGATGSEISRKAGFTNSMITYQFGTKRRLLESVFKKLYFLIYSDQKKKWHQHLLLKSAYQATFL